jgi:hypothetical protein
MKSFRQSLRKPEPRKRGSGSVIKSVRWPNALHKAIKEAEAKSAGALNFSDIVVRAVAHGLGVKL